MASPERFFGRDPAAYREGVVAAYRAIVADPRGTRIAVFTHGMATKTILCALLGLPETGYGLFSIAHSVRTAKRCLKSCSLGPLLAPSARSPACRESV